MNNDNRYILFYIGCELYGTPLLDVREVVEYQEPKYMPNMVSHFTGVINIRGSIVGVMDLRKKFSQNTQVNKTTAFLVSDSEQGSIAAVVDRVDSVQSIAKESIDEKPPIMTSVNQEYLIGIAKIKDQLVTLINLHSLLSEEKLIKVTAAA